MKHIFKIIIPCLILIVIFVLLKKGYEFFTDCPKSSHDNKEFKVHFNTIKYENIDGILNSTLSECLKGNISKDTGFYKSEKIIQSNNEIKYILEELNKNYYYFLYNTNLNGRTSLNIIHNKEVINKSCNSFEVYIKDLYDEKVNKTVNNSNFPYSLNYEIILKNEEAIQSTNVIIPEKYDLNNFKPNISKEYYNSGNESLGFDDDLDTELLNNLFNSLSKSNYDIFTKILEKDRSDITEYEKYKFLDLYFNTIPTIENTDIFSKDVFNTYSEQTISNKVLFNTEIRLSNLVTNKDKTISSITITHEEDLMVNEVYIRFTREEQLILSEIEIYNSKNEIISLEEDNFNLIYGLKILNETKDISPIIDSKKEGNSDTELFKTNKSIGKVLKITLPLSSKVSKVILYTSTDEDEQKFLQYQILGFSYRTISDSQYILYNKPKKPLINLKKLHLNIDYDFNRELIIPSDDEDKIIITNPYPDNDLRGIYIIRTNGSDDIPITLNFNDNSEIKNTVGLKRLDIPLTDLIKIKTIEISSDSIKKISNNIFGFNYVSSNDYIGISSSSISETENIPSKQINDFVYSKLIFEDVHKIYYANTIDNINIKSITYTKKTDIDLISKYYGKVIKIKNLSKYLSFTSDNLNLGETGDEFLIQFTDKGNLLYSINRNTHCRIDGKNLSYDQSKPLFYFILEIQNRKNSDIETFKMRQVKFNNGKLEMINYIYVSGILKTLSEETSSNKGIIISVEDTKKNINKIIYDQIIGKKSFFEPYKNFYRENETSFDIYLKKFNSSYDKATHIVVSIDNNSITDKQVLKIKYGKNISYRVINHDRKIHLLFLYDKRIFKKDDLNETKLIENLHKHIKSVDDKGMETDVLKKDKSNYFITYISEDKLEPMITNYLNILAPDENKLKNAGLDIGKLTLLQKLNPDSKLFYKVTFEYKNIKDIENIDNTFKTFLIKDLSLDNETGIDYTNLYTLLEITKDFTIYNIKFSMCKELEESEQTKLFEDYKDILTISGSDKDNLKLFLEYNNHSDEVDEECEKDYRCFLKLIESKKFNENESIRLIVKERGMYDSVCDVKKCQENNINDCFIKELKNDDKTKFKYTKDNCPPIEHFISGSNNKNTNLLTNTICYERSKEYDVYNYKIYDRINNLRILEENNRLKEHSDTDYSNKKQEELIQFNLDYLT